MQCNGEPKLLVPETKKFKGVLTIDFDFDDRCSRYLVCRDISTQKKK